MAVKKAIYDILLWRGLNFLAAFILNVLIARSLEAGSSGALFFFINNLSLLILVLGFSLEAGMAYYLSSGKASAAATGLLALVWAAVATLLAYGLIRLIGAAGYPLLQQFTRPAALCFIAGSLLTAFYSALWYAKKDFFVPNVSMLVVNLLLVFLFVLGNVNDLPLSWLTNMYFAGFLAQGVVIAFFYHLKNGWGEWGLPAAGETKQILHYAAAAFVANFVFFLVYRIDYWFVETYCNANDLGNYIQVSRIIQWMLLVPMMISTAVFPLTAADGGPGIVQKVMALSRILFTIYLAGCLVLAIAGRWLFVWLFGDTYSLMYPVYLLHIPGILALAALYPISSYNAGIGQVNINIKGSLWALAIIVGGNLLVTPRYGIYGASVVCSLGYLAYLVYSLYRFSSHHAGSRGGFFFMRTDDYSMIRSLLPKRK